MTYQLTAPLLDACVLGIVEKEDAYGYTLTQKVRELVDISESTLYPVLRRLQKDECLITYDAPYQGRNRRYYAITDYGRRRLDFYKDEWEKYKENIDKLLAEENKQVEATTDTENAEGKEEQGNE
ncbi:PadR family transcriptional regulator, regulatory protein PadR [Lachnospiraceae bacterium NE2001]|nr:PadR family transcriptional regulator, regulatory protein PadR [Lachnospiraceae bacterium NE2001]